MNPDNPVVNPDNPDITISPIPDISVTPVPDEDADIDTSQLPELKDYFPFCIPWDISALLNKFQATPEAPVIKFPIKSKLYNIDEVITIDLSMFDEQAKMLRSLELVLFIIGLLILTKHCLK